MQDLTKSYTPGSRSTKLDEISALAWNAQVGHVLATASTSGYTVVWDLRGKREVVALTYGGGPTGGPVGLQGRRGVGDVAWHPGNVSGTNIRYFNRVSMTQRIPGHAPCHLVRR
jgi:protein transport protein SEC31